jgi:HAMP domain-containing protein
LDTSTKKLDAALSARVDLMRGVESALYEHRAKDLAQLRDDDVTALEIRIAILGALMLLAVGIATAMARTLTRPLSVLRRGSARLAEAEDPAAEEPIKFTGRNDEFAQVVRSVNALHAHAAALHERIATLEADRKHLVGQRQKMADAREELRAELADSATQLERLRTSIGGTFVNLALRTLGLVERQLAVIEGLEEREQDPDRLATLFKLDHFATVMRRHTRTSSSSPAPNTSTSTPARSRSSTSSGPPSARSSATSASASPRCRRTRTSPGSPRTTSATSWPNSWRTQARSPRRTPPSRSPAGSWRTARSCSPSRTRASA